MVFLTVFYDEALKAMCHLFPIIVPTLLRAHADLLRSVQHICLKNSQNILQIYRRNDLLRSETQS